MKLLPFILLLSITTLAQQAKKTLIIDSDAGTDDYRTIILLSQLKNYEIKAITLSDGTIFPDKGAARVNQLLKCLNVQNILVGTGKKTMYTKPVWRAFSESVPWGTCAEKENHIVEYPNATQIINKILDDSKENSVTFVCLGSLSNLYESLMINPGGIKKIKEVIWSNSSTIKQGTNYTFEPKAADYILNQPIKIKIISKTVSKYIHYDLPFIQGIKNINHLQSKEIAEQLDFLSQQSNISHLQLYDELCALYLANPRLFTFKEDFNNPYIENVVDYNIDDIKKTYLNLLKGIVNNSSNVIFNDFPSDSIYLQDDVFKIKNKVIEQYGMNEFKAVVLTSEIHNHLGVYSIIGAKMGIKALEILDATNTTIQVTSNAGNTPPLSCLNDGIMVSTGSSPAYNLLKIDTTLVYPSATFCYHNRCIKISLKKEIYNQVSAQLSQAVQKYTLSSSAYWNYVRELGIQLWESLNRDEIFDIDEIH